MAKQETYEPFLYCGVSVQKLFTVCRCDVRAQYVTYFTRTSSQNTSAITVELRN